MPLQEEKDDTAVSGMELVVITAVLSVAHVESIVQARACFPVPERMIFCDNSSVAGSETALSVSSPVQLRCQNSHCTGWTLVLDPLRSCSCPLRLLDTHCVGCKLKTPSFDPPAEVSVKFAGTAG